MIKKYSVTIAGHATSITLEPEFWAELQTMATAQKTSVAAIVAETDKSRGKNNLSSALRLRVIGYLKRGHHAETI